MSTIVSSGRTTIASPTGDENSRHTVRGPDGKLWAFVAMAGDDFGVSLEIYLSQDSGATWLFANSVSTYDAAYGGANAYVANYPSWCAAHIDANNHLHLVYKDPSNGYLYYRHGVLGTDYNGDPTWNLNSTYYQVDTNTANEKVSVVSHPEGANATVHIAWCNAGVLYRRLTVDSTGAVVSSAGNYTLYSDAYSSFSPTLDFEHTGDGYTPKSTYPSVYLGYATTSYGDGIIVHKMTHNGLNSWSNGAQEKINPNYGDYYSAYYWFQVFWDGTACIAGGCLMDMDVSVDLTVFYERTGTGTYAKLFEVPAAITAFKNGSASFDEKRNLYVAASDGTAIRWWSWKRASNTFTGEVEVDASGDANSYPSAQLSYSAGGRIYFVYSIDGGSGKRNVLAAYISTNMPPVAPTDLTLDKAEYLIGDTVHATFTYSDAEGDPLTKVQFRWRRIG